MPPVARLAKAAAISKGLTPEVPRATEGTGASGLLIPQRRAVSMTDLGPMRPTSCAATEFTLWASARLRIIGPSCSPLKFRGVQAG